MASVVLVLYRNSLLAQIVASILGTDQQTQLAVADIEQVDPLTAVRDVNPGVVILDICNLEYLSEFLRTFLREGLGGKILFLDPLANSVYSLHSRNKAIGGAADFLNTVSEMLQELPGGEEQ